MDIKSSGKTDIGLVREVNEDAVNLLPDKNLYIVCDGMGGHNAGEVASQSACQVVGTLYDQFFDRLLKDDDLRLPRVFPPSTDVLIKAVRIANHTIYSKSVENPAYSGMGTTIVAVAIEKDIITILHVGDSRIYRFADNTLTPLTVDHSWAAELEQSENLSSEEARNLVNRNVITRALGVKEDVEIDVAIRKLAANEMYILCSDGLCGFVDDKDIKDAIGGAGSDVEKTVEQLIQMANDRGGMDNVSVAALGISGKIASSDHSKLKTVTVEAEPHEYFENEKQWGLTALDHAKIITSKPGKKKENSRSAGLIAFSVVLVIIVIALIFILK